MINLASLLVLFFTEGSTVDNATGCQQWVQTLKNANLPRFWINELKKSPFFKDFSGNVLHCRFHVNMSVN